MSSSHLFIPRTSLLKGIPRRLGPAFGWTALTVKRQHRDDHEHDHEYDQVLDHGLTGTATTRISFMRQFQHHGYHTKEGPVVTTAIFV